jgi:TP901 family phage tail tape measure protein
MSVDITALSIEVKSTGIKEASNALGGLSTSAANTEKRISALIATMQRLSSISGNVQTTTASTAALTAALNALNNTITQLNQRTTQADRIQRQHNEGMREAHALARGLSGSLGALWLTYGNLMGMMAGVALGSSLKAIFTLGKDIEHTLEGIRVKGQESVGSINDLRKSVLELGTGIYGPQEVAKAFDTLIMAGLNAKDAMKGMKDALNLALIGGTTIDKAAFTLVQVSTALGYTAEGFSRVGDVIAKTAAVSMSSVESLSEAFKSGSVVGKLYGISIVDIGTAFAALSNLGIRGSAAGTSLKNMYKELSADSENLKKTLNLIGLKPQNLKDVEGNFKPMIEMFDILSTKLGNYTAAEQKTLLARMSNERGMKSLVEILSLYREKLVQTGDSTGTIKNKLEAMNKAINESYGFMAQGAAAMALTVDSQFKSVANTLQVTLIKAFQGIQPQLSLVARGLKETFSSPAFTNGVQTLALGVANLTSFIVRNADVMWDLVRAFLAFKAASMVTGLLVGLAEAFIIVKTAMIEARVAALAFQASLGLIGLALAASAALFVWWSTKRKEAMEDGQKAAINYMTDFKDKLIEENARLEDQIDLMMAGATATDAYVQAQQRLQLQKVKEQGALATGGAQSQVDKTYAGFNQNQKNAIAQWVAGNKDLDKYDGQQITALKEYTRVTQNLVKVKDQVRKEEEETSAALERNIGLAEASAEIADRKAKERGKMPGGGDTIPEEVKKAALNDQMNKELGRINGEIEAAKRKAMQEKENAQSEYRQGMIGELTMIERIKEAEQNREGNYAEKAFDKIKVLQKYANQESAIEQEKSSITASMQATKDAQADADNKRAEFSAKVIQETQKAEIEAYQKTGQFVLAYLAEDGKKHDIRGKQLKDSYEQSTNSMEMYRIAMLMEANDVAKAAGIKAAANKEAEASFNLLADRTRNAMKGTQTAAEGNGLAEMFKAAQAASAAYAASLPDLKAKLAEMTDPKGIEEANARMINLAETQRKLWVGVGESISNSLESAFGKGGKAAGDLIKVAVNYSNLEKKDGAARVKAYGDAAGAAKGFFKEGTTGYKLMAAAEMAFRVVELAGMAKSLAATIANAAAKAAAYIPAVFMSFMASLGPWGIAAAGVAIAAVLGGAFSGGGGAPPSAEQRQKSQGSGSVLGDPEAKSESISKSLAIMEKNSGLGLVQGNSMIVYLRAMATSLTGLAQLVVRTSGITGDTAADKMTGVGGFVQNSFMFKFDSLLGGFLNKFAGKLSNALFGGKVSVQDTGFTMGKQNLGTALTSGINASQYADTKKDGGLFHSDKYSTQMQALGGETNAQFSKIINSMYGTMIEASKQLGIGGDAFTKKLQSFVIDIGKISLKGMTGEQIQKAIEAVFSKLGDDMAKFAISGLDKFQKVGEGYLETVVRIVNDLMQVKDVFAVLDKSFNLTGIAAVTVAEGLIEAAGSLEKLTEGTKYFVDNFLTEAERLSPITKSLAKRMVELNIADVTSIDLFKKKIRSLDLTNKADQELYAAMLELAPAFKEVTDYADKLKDGTVELTKAQKKLIDAVTTARSNLQKAYDTEKSSLQGVIDKTKTYIQTLKDFQNSLKLGANSPLTNQQKYAEARRQFDATAIAAKAGDAAAQGKFTSIANEFLNASRIINASGQAYTTDFETVLAITKSLEDAAVGQVDVATASLEALNRQVENLIEINTSVLTVTQAVNELNAAITAGRAGGVSDGSMGIPGATTSTPTQQDVLVKAVLDAIAAQAAATAAAAQQSAQQTAAIVNGQNEAAQAGAEVTASTIVAAIGGLPGLRQVVSIK